MTQTPFDLDTAMDAVAKQLTHVEHDPHLSARIATSLPERSSWSLGWWAPRLALITIVVAAGIVWGNRGEVVTPASPLASSQPFTTPTVLVASVREAEPNRTMPLERLERLEPLEPREPARSDFERSLSALDAVNALALAPLAPVSLPEDAPLTLAPLAIADLPLAPESISPR